MITTKLFFPTCLLVCMLLGGKLMAQHVGIGTTAPTQQLDVNGGIRIGGTDAATTGSVRWNAVTSDFEGYNGAAWVSLTGGKGRWGNQASFMTESSASFNTLTWANKPGTELGHALATANNWMIAGAFRDAVPNFPEKWDAGGCRIYQRVGDEWRYRWALYDPDAATNDFFGYSVGMSPSHVVVGAIYADPPGFPDAGKAYVYHYDSTGVTMQASLLASDREVGDSFGGSVAISGDHIVVGAYANDILGHDNMGRAYVFTRTGTNWPQTHILTPSDGEENDYYGRTVAAGENYLAITSLGKTVNGHSGAGKVYVYRKNASAWTLAHQLTSPAPYSGAYYGQSLAIHGNILLVSEPGPIGNGNSPIGKVYRYTLSPSSATLDTTLSASDGLPGEGFGFSVSLNGDAMLVGAPYATIGAGYRTGKAYVFEMQGGAWTQTAILSASTGESQMLFGKAVAMAEGWGLVGAPFADLSSRPDNGQIFFFKQY